MLTWFYRLVASLSAKFIPARIGLFRFYDGRQWRRVDPLAVARDLFTDRSDFDWDETPKLLTSGVAMIQLEGTARIARAVRAAFSLPSIEVGGLTELECYHLLQDLSAWLGHVKKNGNLFPTLKVCTPEQSPETDAGTFPTKPGAVFGSTDTVPSVVPPGLPPEPIFASSAKP